MRSLTLIALVFLASCDTERADTETAKLGPLRFEVPLDWQRTNHEPTGAQSADWKPTENTGRESLTVVRGKLLDKRAAQSTDHLSMLLAGAQGTLRNAKVSPVSTLSTRRGLQGARIDVTFQPGDDPQRYRRVHVVLLDAARSELVHVLYTAAAADANVTAFYTVLDSLHREEG